MALLGAAASLIVLVGLFAVVGTGGSSEVGSSLPASDPRSDWSGFPHPPIEPRFQYAAVSTGDGIFVWGGCCADDQGEVPYTDGAYYDGASAEWRVLPEAPLDGRRGDAVAAWTGSEVIVLNGIDEVRAAAFDPSTFTWRPLQAPVDGPAGNGGARLFTVGGGRVALVHNVSVQLFDTATETWVEPVDVPEDPTAYELSSNDDGTPERRVVGYSASGSVIALTTAPSNGCVGARVETLDLTSGSRRSIDLPATGWLPTDTVGIDDGRFVVSGTLKCGPDRDQPVNSHAFLLDGATGEVREISAPLVETDGFRYSGVWTGEAVVHLDSQGRLSAYRPATDGWTLGDRVVDRTVAEASGIGETPIVWFDGAIRIVSPGYERNLDDGASQCCWPVAEAWSSPVPG
jgi:hypothetical protein